MDKGPLTSPLFSFSTKRALVSGSSFACLYSQENQQLILKEIGHTWNSLLLPTANTFSEAEKECLRLPFSVYDNGRFCSILKMLLCLAVFIIYSYASQTIFFSFCSVWSQNSPLPSASQPVERVVHLGDLFMSFPLPQRISNWCTVLALITSSGYTAHCCCLVPFCPPPFFLPHESSPIV